MSRNPPRGRGNLAAAYWDGYQQALRDLGKISGRRWRWLDSTVRLQREAFGFDLDEMHDDAEAQAAAVKENILAAIVELVEMLNEVKWKYWSHEEPWVRRDRVLKEAVDVNHFVGNALASVGITDDEYEEAYRAKQQENRDRQKRKYVSQQAEENR